MFVQVNFYVQSKNIDREDAESSILSIFLDLYLLPLPIYCHTYVNHGEFTREFLPNLPFEIQYI